MPHCPAICTPDQPNDVPVAAENDFRRNLHLTGNAANPVAAGSTTAWLACGAALDARGRVSGAGAPLV